MSTKLSSNNEIKELRVANKTSTHSLAGSITIEIKKHGKVAITAIGAGSVNTAIKGIAVARGQLAAQGAEVWSYPYFSKTNMKDNSDEERTCMCMVVEDLTYKQQRA